MRLLISLSRTHGNDRGARFVALVDLLASERPGHETGAIADGRVLVDGRVLTNPAAKVRADAALRVVPDRRLRGDIKLSHALEAFSVRSRASSQSTWGPVRAGSPPPCSRTERLGSTPSTSASANWSVACDVILGSSTWKATTWRSWTQAWSPTR